MRIPEELEKGAADPISLHLFRVAVATGARLGELLALDQDDESIRGRRRSSGVAGSALQVGLWPPPGRLIYTRPGRAARWLAETAPSSSHGPLLANGG